MNKVESFELDHRKVKAPYVRKCCLLEGPKGDKVTKFDLRFLQPNKEAFGTAANPIQCGNYKDLSLFGAKEYAKEAIEKGFSLNIYGEEK